MLMLVLCFLVFLYPFMAVVVRSYLARFADEGIKAFGTESAWYGAASIILMVIFVPFCLLMGLLNFEFSPKSNDVMARSNLSDVLRFLVCPLSQTLTANMHVVSDEQFMEM